MQARIATLLAVISLSLPQVYASNFTFSYGNASQCETFNISWSGGTAPYELTIVPSYNRPTTYSIPSSSYSNGNGSYQVQLVANASDQFVAVMSDASGFGSGGVSDVITVGDGPSNCNRVLDPVDFYYDTDMALNQCRIFSFTNYNNASQPVTITGMVPGGQTFTLKPPKGTTDFEWTADVAAGTELIFFMTDSKGNSGGSTQLDTVGLSGDASCLTGAYPSSLAVHPSATATTSSAAATGTGNSGSDSAPVGAIVGGVVGGIVGLGLIAAIVFLYLRRERQKRRYGQSGPFAYNGTRPKNDELDPADGGDDVPPSHHVQPYPYFAPTTGPGSVHSQSQRQFPGAPGDSGQSTVSLMRPVSYAESQGYAGVPSHSRNTSLVEPASPFASSQPGTRDSGMSSAQDRSISMSSASRRKAAMAGVAAYQPNVPTRFILHTDAEDVVELPPQYSSLRPSSAYTHDTDADADADTRRASGSGSGAPAQPPATYPPPPISIPPADAALDSARPQSSIIEEPHAHAGLQEPIAPSSASVRSPAPAYDPRPA